MVFLPSLPSRHFWSCECGPLRTERYMSTRPALRELMGRHKTDSPAVIPIGPTGCSAGGAQTPERGRRSGWHLMARTGPMLWKTTQGWRSLSHFEDGGGLGPGRGRKAHSHWRACLRGSGRDSRGHMRMLKEGGAWEAGEGGVRSPVRGWTLRPHCCLLFPVLPLRTLS